MRHSSWPRPVFIIGTKRVTYGDVASKRIFQSEHSGLPATRCRRSSFTCPLLLLQAVTRAHAQLASSIDIYSELHRTSSSRTHRGPFGTTSHSVQAPASSRLFRIRLYPTRFCQINTALLLLAAAHANNIDPSTAIESAFASLAPCRALRFTSRCRPRSCSPSRLQAYLLLYHHQSRNVRFARLSASRHGSSTSRCAPRCLSSLRPPTSSPSSL